MEFIEGPDLEELLKPPHDPVFSLKETIHVAEQLSNALAHCHRRGVKHGDIKSNNVKFNIRTGNYVLLDFGLAIMSDEQRRTSLRHAGAVEFMAPEQNEGQMLYETDVYSFGIILFELLAGRVPFPLNDKGETARNMVRLAHIETPPPDVIALRREALPATWTQQKKDMEMAIPQWLLNVLYKCLNKQPEQRFASGMELHDYIINNSIHALPNNDFEQLDLLKKANEKLLLENEQLQKQVSQYEQVLASRRKELEQTKYNRSLTQPLTDNTTAYYTAPAKKGVSTAAFFTLIVLAIALTTFGAYIFLQNNTTNNSIATTNGDQQSGTSDIPEATSDTATIEDAPVEKTKDTSAKAGSAKDSTSSQADQLALAAEQALIDEQNNQQNTPETTDKPPGGKQYMVVSKAYFYNSPDTSTRRSSFVVPSNNAVFSAIDETGDFVLISFTNQYGQVTKGWLQKKDLQAVSE